jgi:catalase
MLERRGFGRPSVVDDGVVVLGGASAVALTESGLAMEAYRHGKPIAAIGDGSTLLEVCSLGNRPTEEGVIVGRDDVDAIAKFVAALKQHRFPRRPIAGVPA